MFVVVVHGIRRGKYLNHVLFNNEKNTEPNITLMKVIKKVINNIFMSRTKVYYKLFISELDIIFYEVAFIGVKPRINTI